MGPARVAAIGEGMIELARIDPVARTARVGFAGDTMNTAIYLARLGVDVTYVTNLGVDALSDALQDRCEVEGIDCRLIGRHPTRLPAIYAVQIDAAGERSFSYWRDTSAARTLFSGIGARLDDLDGFDVIYLSGITLAILPPDVRAALIAKAAALKAAGKMIIFDNNFRPWLWDSVETARDCYAAMYPATTLALPSYDDEACLYPGEPPARTVQRLRDAGVVEGVLKKGSAGPILWQGDKTETPSLAPARAVADTSGAGDSFNAGYLAARLVGMEPLAAVQAGHRLASTVIAHHGAVILREAMPA